MNVSVCETASTPGVFVVAGDWPRITWAGSMWKTDWNTLPVSTTIERLERRRWLHCYEAERGKVVTTLSW